MKGVELAGDRRHTRYTRLRKAIADGLAPAPAEDRGGGSAANHVTHRDDELRDFVLFQYVAGCTAPEGFRCHYCAVRRSDIDELDRAFFRLDRLSDIEAVQQRY